MFWKLVILLLFSNTLIVANGFWKDFGNVAQEKHLRFQKRLTFTYFWNKKFSKDQLFLERLLNELESQIEATQERNKEREEEIKRNIINNYLVRKSSARFLNDFLTLRY